MGDDTTTNLDPVVDPTQDVPAAVGDAVMGGDMAAPTQPVMPVEGTAGAVDDEEEVDGVDGADA